MGASFLVYSTDQRLNIKKSRKPRTLQPVSYTHLACCPVSFVTKAAPPFLIIHGEDDHTVPFGQGEELHDELEKAGCDVTLLSIEDADHADLHFFQKEVWDEICAFFRAKL